MSLLKSLLSCILLFLMLAILSCNGEKDSAFKSISITDDGTIPLKNLSIDKEIILDTGTDIIGNIFTFTIIEDNFLVVDTIHSRQCYLLDNNGKLLKKIGKYGEGPGEYIFILASCYSNGRIFIIESNKINIYNKDGDFLLSKRRPFLGLCNGAYPGPENSILALSYNRYNTKNDTIYQLDQDGNLIKSFSKADYVPNVFDTFYPQTGLCIAENGFFQFFNFKYELAFFDNSGEKIKKIKIASKFYTPPDFSKANVRGHKAEKKYRASFTQLVGFSKYSDGYVSLLCNWQNIKSPKYIYEIFSKNFTKLGYFELKSDEFPLAVHNDRIITADFEDETKLIFRKISL